MYFDDYLAFFIKGQKQLTLFRVHNGAQNLSYPVCNRDSGMNTKNFEIPTFKKMLTGKWRMPIICMQISFFRSQTGKTKTGILFVWIIFSYFDADIRIWIG